MKKISHVKFQRDVFWLKPFLLAAVPVIPVERLTAVKGFKVPLNQTVHAHGSCQTTNFKRFTITLCTHSASLEALGYETFKAVKHKRNIAVNVLQTFAHELAHLSHWSHSPEHLALETKITRRFVSVLKRQKVKELDVRKKLVPYVSLLSLNKNRKPRP